ncbi:MAG: hypothetical protein ACFFHD_02530 [Promethearchaeota archaeon]
MKKFFKWFFVIVLIIVVLGITAYFALNEFFFNNKDDDQTPPITPPESPTILTLNQTISTDRLLIQWTSVNKANNYSVYVDGIFNVSSDDTQEEVLFLTNGTYQITVTAINKSGESPHSAPVSIIVAIPPISLGLIHIYVNSTIYSTILSNITQYKQEINIQGYKVNVINWSINNVTQLKNHIISNYSNGLIGAVLIGKLPYAQARYWDASWSMYRYFSCDYYLMDLDGNWTDVNKNGYYDVGASDNHVEHNNGTADALPEIWVARISPYTISKVGFNPISSLSDFFYRDHKLRNGSTYRPHKGLLFIDDEWAAYEDDWKSIFTAYTGSNLTCEADCNYYGNDFTNATYFLSNISDVTHPTFTNYELVHVMAHCNGTEQQFGINGYQYPNYNADDGILTYNDIYMNGPQPLFFNLYSCFSANLMIQNNIATHYLFSGESLVVIGCARSGGMCLYEPFYDALKDGKIFGQAFKEWFYGSEIITYHHWEEVYGMKLFGDPLLTVYMT